MALTRLEKAKLQLSRVGYPDDWHFFYNVVEREKKKLSDIAAFELAATALKPSWDHGEALEEGGPRNEDPIGPKSMFPKGFVPTFTPTPEDPAYEASYEGRLNYRISLLES